MADAKNIFGDPIQIGLIVEDADKIMKNLQDILGIGPFRVVDYPAEGAELEMTYMGKPAQYKAKFCFFMWGNIEIELIQPLEGDSVWKDFIESQPNRMGLHHIKFLVPEHEPVREYLASKGIPCTQHGASVGINAGKEFVFYGTDEKLGFALEIMNSIVKK